MIKICENCRFSEFFDKEDRVMGSNGKNYAVGECRRYPPKKMDYQFPRVSEITWCGEWQPKIDVEE